MSEHSEEHGHALTIPYCKSMDGSAAQRDRGTEAERPSGESKSVTAATTSYIDGGAGICHVAGSEEGWHLSGDGHARPGNAGSLSAVHLSLDGHLRLSRGRGRHRGGRAARVGAGAADPGLRRCCCRAASCTGHVLRRLRSDIEIFRSS
jgi:hypothetical protein